MKMNSQRNLLKNLYDSVKEHLQRSIDQDEVEGMNRDELIDMLQNISHKILDFELPVYDSDMADILAENPNFASVNDKSLLHENHTALDVIKMSIYEFLQSEYDFICCDVVDELLPDLDDEPLKIKNKKNLNLLIKELQDDTKRSLVWRKNKIDPNKPDPHKGQQSVLVLEHNTLEMDNKRENDLIKVYRQLELVRRKARELPYDVRESALRIYFKVKSLAGAYKIGTCTLNDFKEKVKATLQYGECAEPQEQRWAGLSDEARLKTHRGWKQVLMNLLAAVLMLGIGYLIAAAVLGRLSLFKPDTDSGAKLDKLTKSIEKLI